MLQHSELHETASGGQGRAAYASSAAETVFFRRAPQQLASTLAFMLGRDEGKMWKIRESEVEPLKECLLWLRNNNPHVKTYYTAFEKFQKLFQRPQTVVPQDSSLSSE